jgi:hypothetical protein
MIGRITTGATPVTVIDAAVGIGVTGEDVYTTGATPVIVTVAAVGISVEDTTSADPLTVIDADAGTRVRVVIGAGFRPFSGNDRPNLAI